MAWQSAPTAASEEMMATVQASTPSARCEGAGMVEHVGVVFVHGVGSQARGETLRSWLHPVIRLLREGTSGAPHPDPVLVASTGADDGRPATVELEIPASGNRAVEHWVITEAWWASSITPPKLSAIVSWLTREGGISRVAGRLRGHTTSAHHREPDPSSWHALPAEALVGTLAAGLLVIYALLHPIFLLLPLDRLRSVVLGPIDSILTTWMGDMRVLATDEAQAAFARARVAEAVDSLVQRGSTRVALVAHSGGAVLSYMTLTDTAYASPPVDRLITMGQGLNIAWDLTTSDLGHRASSSVSLSDRLLRLISANRPVTWYDFYASRDPVPGGPIRNPVYGGSEPVKCPSDRGEPDNAVPGCQVSNRVSVLSDHGTYFENDEEFLVPLLRHLDSRTADPATSRFFPDERARREVVARRRERLAALAMIRQATFGVAALAVVAAATASFAQFFALEYFEGDGAGFVQRPAEGLIAAGTRFLLELPGVQQGVDWFQTFNGLGPIGFLLWGLLLSLLTWNLVPEPSNWEPIRRHSFASALLAGALTGALWVTALFAFLFVIPAWVGSGLREYRLEPSEFVYSLLSDLEPSWLATPIANVVVTYVPVITLGVVVLGFRARFGSATRRQWPPWLLYFVASAGMAAVVACALGAANLLVRTYGYHLMGWLVLFLGFTAFGSLATWRWAVWDEGERREARSRLSGGPLGLRMLGRSVDLVVILVFIGAGAVLAIGVGIAPVLPNSGSTLIWTGVALTGLAFIGGVVQDYVNGPGLTEHIDPSGAEAP